jgi:hypothetical protein
MTAKRSFLHDNGLSLAAFGLFVASLAGQAVTGRAFYNEEALQHGRQALTLLGYLSSGAFIEAVFENWESEFLQMALFVILTKGLRQKGSSESKRLAEPEDVDEDPRRHRADPQAPWPVHKGGLLLRAYEHSLSIALVLLFLAAFALHAYGGMLDHNEDEARHGGEFMGLIGYVSSPRFWQESFQNWQSEFFSVAALVLLSIVLRERGSPQSKAVADPHRNTGGG